MLLQSVQTKTSTYPISLNYPIHWIISLYLRFSISIFPQLIKLSSSDQFDISHCSLLNFRFTHFTFLQDDSSLYFVNLLQFVNFLQILNFLSVSKFSAIRQYFQFVKLRKQSSKLLLVSLFFILYFS